MIIGIVAIARNNAIGKDGKLPWHYSADLKFFKETTTGNAVVMGFNTWRAIGKPLPNRLNIVLSRSAQLEDDANLLFLRSKDQVIKLSEYLRCDVFIIGGAKTYADSPMLSIDGSLRRFPLMLMERTRLCPQILPMALRVWSRRN